jgi:hypothetical protein
VMERLAVDQRAVEVEQNGLRGIQPPL